MTDLYYWPTPNGHKVTMFLEEAELDYTIHPVDISAGDQFKPAVLAFSPNNRMPAIIDRDPADGGEPVPAFESGAILLYLAEKTGPWRPASPSRRRLSPMCSIASTTPPSTFRGWNKPAGRPLRESKTSL
jgi:GST-like protein